MLGKMPVFSKVTGLQDIPKNFEICTGKCVGLSF